MTILFSDVAGSTALGERLDPESLREVMGRSGKTIEPRPMQAPLQSM